MHVQIQQGIMTRSLYAPTIDRIGEIGADMEKME
jgi:hypothetical protein